jgi:hypothetical protein
VYTEADVARIVAAVLAQVARSAQEPRPRESRSYTLRQVAAMTNLSWRRIADGCRKGEIDHIHDGGKRVMTEEQIAKLLAARTRRSTDVETPAQPADEMARARELSRRSANRQTPRRS